MHHPQPDCGRDAVDIGSQTGVENYAEDATTGTHDDHSAAVGRRNAIPRTTSGDESGTVDESDSTCQHRNRVAAMASSLRVDPSALCATAATESGVAGFMAELPVAQSMTRAAGNLADLLSGSACRIVGDVLDDVARTLADELSTHSERLAAAAERYRRADEDLGRRLRVNDCGRSATPP